jgi:hypothetical protein
MNKRKIKLRIDKRLKYSWLKMKPPEMNKILLRLVKILFKKKNPY